MIASPQTPPLLEAEVGRRPAATTGLWHWRRVLLPGRRSLRRASSSSLEPPQSRPRGRWCGGSNNFLSFRFAGSGSPRLSEDSALSARAVARASVESQCELDALSFDHDSPGLDLRDPEGRDDVSQTHKSSVDERLWRSAHQRALHPQLGGFCPDAVHPGAVLFNLIGTVGHGLCELIPETVAPFDVDGGFRSGGSGRAGAVEGEGLVIGDEQVA